MVAGYRTPPNLAYLYYISRSTARTGRALPRSHNLTLIRSRRINDSLVNDPVRKVARARPAHAHYGSPRQPAHRQEAGRRPARRRDGRPAVMERGRVERTVRVRVTSDPRHALPWILSARTLWRPRLMTDHAPSNVPAALPIAVDQLSTAEKVALLAGETMWTTTPVPRLGI